jgi:26S proteasome regulatory subunit N9
MASLVAFSLPDGTRLLSSLLDDKERYGPAASLYLYSRLGLLRLTLLARDNVDLSSPSAMQQLEQISTSMESQRATLQQLADTESEAAIVHSAFYEMTMTYRKAVGPPESYYREAIQYVAYTNLSELSVEHRYHLAVDLSLSALTGEGVFNFGEITASPILEALIGTECEYMRTLLECGSHGDVLGFQSVADTHSDEIAAQPSLVSRAEAVKEKITLLALVNMVFERPSLERTLQFEDIAHRVCVSIEQVEWVIMRALSLKLIEGTMDQVEQTVDVTWVMPRVLNGKQMEELATRFGEWAVKVSKTRDYMLEAGGALLNQ